MNYFIKIAAIAVVLTGCTTPIPSALADHESIPSDFADRVTAGWRCTDLFDESSTIVRAWILDDNPNGKIEAQGVVKDAFYRQPGLEHRWDFDQNPSDDTYDAAFIIKPNGTGGYFYFGNESEAKPSIVTECTKTK